MHHDLLGRILTAGRTNLAQHWKRGTLSTIQDWKTIIGESATMEKLTAYIHNRSLTKFKQERLFYI